MIDRSELKGIDVHELAKTLRPLVSHASSAYRYVTSSVAIAVDKEAVAIWRDFSRVCGATGVRNAEGDFGAAWIFDCSEKFPAQLLEHQLLEIRDPISLELCLKTEEFILEWRGHVPKPWTSPRIPRLFNAT